MSAVLILTPLIIGSWPAISAAAGGAAIALGLTARSVVKEKTRAAAEEQVETQNSVVAELTDSEVLQNVATDEEIVLTKGTVELRVKRDARGRCVVCASGRGQTKAQLKAIADEFTQKMTQCFVYNRVMTELKAKGFQVVNEEQMQDETVRIHVRRWEA